MRSSPWVSAFFKALVLITSLVNCPSRSRLYGSDHTGTSTLEALTSNPAVETDTHSLTPGLKYDTSGPTPILLVPQPSSDPADPLNWPRWRRDLVLLILSLMSVIASTLSPLLAANSLDLTFYFGRNLTEIALLTGYHLLGVAIAGFLCVPSARIWGKRHLYIIGTAVIVLSSLWGGLSNHNYKSLVAARFFQGVGLAPFEALVNASVGDLFFVHERGKRMALSNLCLFGGAFFTPVLVGKITASIGWQWTFYFLAIFSAIMLPLIVLFVPETAFVRPESCDIDSTGTVIGARDHIANPTLQMDHVPADKLNSPQVNDHDIEHAPLSPKYNDTTHKTAPLLKSLALFNGRKSSDKFWTLALRPLPLFAHPGILWACLIQGTMIGWTVLIGIVLAAVTLQAPLFFSEEQVGYMYTGAFLGALIGFLLAGLISDPSIRFLAHKNHGVFEPEFRIPALILPMAVLGCAGIFGFGITSNDVPKYGWFWPDFFFALQVAGTILGAVVSALYIVDAHRDIAIEAFTCLLVFKNIFSFALTFRGYDWLVHSGIKATFVAVGITQVVVCCTSLAMCKSPFYVSSFVFLSPLDLSRLSARRKADIKRQMFLER